MPSRVYEVIRGYGQKIVQPLLGMLGSGNLETRLIIIQILGEIGDINCLPIFKKILGDNNTQLNRGVAEAIKNLRLKEGWTLLLPLLEDEKWQTRLAAVQGLAVLEIKEAVPFLEIRKNMENEEIVQECISDAINSILEATAPQTIDWVREGQG